MNTSYWPINNSGNTTSLVAQLSALWQNLLARLETNTEPHVWQTSDGSDQTLWNAYDPITQMTINHASADELRIWLEELHYRN